MGQLSDPYEDDKENAEGISISGLPDEPEPPEDVAVVGPEEPEGNFDAEAVELAAGEMVLVEGTGLDSEEGDEAAGEGDEAAGEGDDGEAPPEEVAYDLTEWEDDQLSVLFDELSEADIEYLWDGEELFVRVEDEVAVDVLIDRVSYPDQLDEEADDGDAGAVLLGDLFVAADRLQHDPEEHEAVAALLTLADAADEATAPYGFSDEEWKHLHEKVDALAELLAAETIDVEEAAASARELRNAIRPYV